MTVVCFYLENGSIPKVDLSFPPRGNPGCGGTEYAMASLIFELSKDQSLEIIVLSQAPINISANRNVLVADLPNAIRAAQDLKGYLVYRAHIHLKQDVLEALETCRTKVIPWMHVTPTSDHLARLGSLDQVVAIISMSARQYLKWADSPAGKKTVNIYNGQYPARVTRNLKVDNIVTYLGALVPQKGFHILADAWPRIISAYPDAQLHVIGSGGLYREADKMGPLGLAEEQYESRFMKSLSGYERSTTFHGRVSNSKKDDLIAQTKVGVVNPSGLTENCPASALDFQSSGVPVVAARKNGLIDTVEHGKTGLLVKDQKGLELSILRLLEDSTLNLEFSTKASQFVEDKFNFDAIAIQWHDLFEKLENGNPVCDYNVPRPVNFTEILTLSNLKLGRIIGKRNVIPSIYRIETLARGVVRKVIRRNS